MRGFLRAAAEGLGRGASNATLSGKVRKKIQNYTCIYKCSRNVQLVWGCNTKADPGENVISHTRCAGTLPMEPVTLYLPGELACICCVELTVVFRALEPPLAIPAKVYNQRISNHIQ